MFKKLFIVTILVVLPGTIWALGFGDITVFSKLNEPLKAHIELIDSKSTPADDVTVKNASLNTYRRANLPKPEALNRVQFKTTKLANGSVIVVLTSKRPIKEPFITFIADLRWRKGHLNREYTFLLDPPEFVLKNTRSSARKVTKTAKKVPGMQKKPTAFRKKPQTTKTEIDHSAVIAAHDGIETYKTRPADSLWNIAKKFKPDNRVTTYQTMQALFVLNPDAFINADINLLKQNQILKVPSVNEILHINGKMPLQKPSRKPSIAVQTTLKKQQPVVRDIEQPADLQVTKKSDAKQDSELQDEAHLKIIPPTQELLNKPVANQEDLKLIKKALKTSINTIQLLHSENESLAEKINELTDKLNNLDSHNEKLNSQITEISTLLKDKQTSVPPESQPANENISATALADKTPTPVEQKVSIEIRSEIGKTKNTRSFVRELLTSPIITFALAIFTIIILGAILFTIRKQNEKRKERKENSYIPYSEVESVKPTPAEKPTINNNRVDESQLLLEKDTLVTEEKPEEEMDFFEYFEKKINAPDESSKTSNIEKSTTKADDSEDNTDEVDFSLNITDEEIQNYEKHITQSYQTSKKNVPDSAIGEIDTYLAYGNYKTAEKLILEGIQSAPDNKNLHLKLFECYSLNNKRYEYMQHTKKIVDILNVDMVLRHRVETIYQQTWNETLNINKFT